MYKPIRNLQLSPRSWEVIGQIQRDVGMMKLGALVISVGNVYSLLLGNSGHSSRVINIATSDWDTYQEVSNYPGLASAWITSVNAVIRNRACLVAVEFPDGQEKEFWKSVAGDRCKI